MPRGWREWSVIVWPGFIAAAVLELIVFAAFDPHDLQLIGLGAPIDRQLVYSLAFFAFWLVTSACGLVVWSLARTPTQIKGADTAPPGATRPH
ncbi:MAG TPA: hypothetical protein VM491_17465 [Burkholderiaceae bacterium]|nr:hypothetical protein [Burkholderiaceae bacterium]